ncbi:XRE family transcriptional regulator [Caenimonas sp. S4]|nr:XRE family transcriptional regulator [Caenimonas soli]
MKLTRAQRATLASALRSRAEARQETQEDVAIAMEMSQGQLSRILAGQFTQLSPNVQKLCTYFGVAPPDQPGAPPLRKRDAQAEREVMNAFRSIWNGSDEQARALAAVIRACGAVSAASIDGA